jgi:hypothetical protein
MYFNISFHLGNLFCKTDLENELDDFCLAGRKIFAGFATLKKG